MDSKILSRSLIGFSLLLTTNCWAVLPSPPVVKDMKVSQYLKFLYDDNNVLLITTTAPNGNRYGKVGELVAYETTGDSYTVLLADFNGLNGDTTFTDSTGKVVTFVGNAQLSTTKKKFGTASLKLDGTGDEVTLVDSPDWALGTGDWTMECWINFNAISSFHAIAGQWNGVAGCYWYINYGAPAYIQFTYGATTKKVVWGSPTAGSWLHFALVRHGNDLMFFVDGTQQGATQDVTGMDITDINEVFSIGGLSNPPSDFINGYIDEFRVSKGIARWTSNFTPPASEYSTSLGNTYKLWTNTDGAKAWSQL